jgi:ribose transport system permease protein
MKKALSSPVARALIALILVLACGLIFNGNGAFFRFGTHRDMLRSVSVYGLLACGMTLVIICGGIDLAVGSVLALGAVFFSLASIHWGWSPMLAIPATLAVGAAVGAASGVLVSWGRFQPFIATLAAMVTARGLAKQISDNQKISTVITKPDGTSSSVDLPKIFGVIDQRVLGDNVAVVTLIFFTVFAITWLLLSRHRWGRELYAIGGNEEAARLSGVPVAWSKTWAYVLSGMFAALAGICQAAQEQQGDPEGGVGYELTAIAIVVIGGTSLMGGRGGVGLTLIGMLTIGYLDKILSLNAVPESTRLIVTGAIVALAVLAQRSRK